MAEPQSAGPVESEIPPSRHDDYRYRKAGIPCPGKHASPGKGSHLHIGQEVTRGERFGFIRFGSRVDVYVPLNSEVLVFVGQKVRAADTVLALLNPQEEEKPETPVEAPAVEAVEVTEVAATADAALAAETKTTEEKTQQQA